MVKRMIGNIILFFLSIAFPCFAYIRVFKISAATVCVLFLFFVLYGCFLSFGGRSMERLKKYEQKQIHLGLSKEDHLRILFFSLTALSPIWLCIFLVSLVPLFTYEVWLITTFPCILLNCLPANRVMEEYHGLTQKKLPFFGLFLLLSIIFCLFGIFVARSFFK